METGQKTETTWSRKRGAHLTLAERGAIQCLRSQGLSLRQIAAQPACAHTTILKELRRGTPEKTGARGPAPAYRAKLGQQTCQSNRLRCRRRFRVPECGAFIEWMSGQIRQRKWSFDACVGYARRAGLCPADGIPCAKTLYNSLRAGLLPVSPLTCPGI